jgi:PadR family transcriptional regulator, regulatory protein PadR
MSGPRAIRMTERTLSVLGAMLADPDADLYGYDLMVQADIKSGTLYPMLARLERAGWVESRWEETQALRRPRRRYYSLTPQGRSLTATELRRREDGRREVQDALGSESLNPRPA